MRIDDTPNGFAGCCDVCGKTFGPYPARRSAQAAVTGHRNTHDQDDPPLPARLLEVMATVNYRTHVEEARHRAKLWLHERAADPARNAEEVLREVVAILDRIPDHPFRGSPRSVNLRRTP